MGQNNKMRWNCEKDGCFNAKCRPKIEVFANCFPGQICFGDMDAIVEINGNFLILEWKSYTTELPVGQQILFKRLTAKGRKTVVVVAHGNAETMEIDQIQVWSDGRSSGWESCSLELLKTRISEWAKRAK